MSDQNLPTATAPACNNCQYFHLGLRQHFPDVHKTVIGECDNSNVPTRICVSYGMLCNGDFHKFKPR